MGSTISDFQVLLFVGNPASPNGNQSASDAEQYLNGLLDPLLEDSLISVWHCSEIEELWANTQVYQGPVQEKTAFKGNLLEQLLPDLICVFSNPEDYESTLDFCQTFRESDDSKKPLLLVHCVAQEEERIRFLLAGADDILDAGLSPEEFKVRLMVHLRRSLDFSVHELTGLPGLSIAQKIVQRRLNRDEAVSVITLSIDQLDVYQESYGDLPTAQLLRACAAMLSRVVLMPPDFISHTDENHFVIITQPEKAEKVAALLCRQFEAAAPNFYSEPDRKRGYMISLISEQVSRRVSLLSLSLGIANSNKQGGQTFTSLFNTSRQLSALARMQPGSAWQSDRLRLSTSTIAQEKSQGPVRPGILVVETDAALAYLLNATLSMEGYAVYLVSGIEEARSILEEKMPLRQIHLVILDTVVHQEEAGLMLTRELSTQYPQLRIICTSSLHNRSQVLQAGAHLYLPRPFELSNLFFWINRLLPEIWP